MQNQTYDLGVLLSAAERWASATGKSRATAATLAVNDGQFFDKIEAGKDCTTKTYRKAMCWLIENMPKENHQPPGLKDGNPS
jgi:hypothetical protein